MSKETLCSPDPRTIGVQRALLGSALFLVFLSLWSNSALLANVRENVTTYPLWGGVRMTVVTILALLIPVSLLGSKKLQRLLVWLTVPLAIFTLLDVTFGGRDPDEAVHLRMAWLWTQGQLPYIDFFTFRHQLWHITLIPLVRWFEDDMRILLVGRLLEFSFTLVTFALLVPICRVARCHPAIPFIVTAFPLFPWGSVEIRSDPPMTMLLVASLWALTKNRGVLAGVFSGLAYLAIQKAAMHGIAIGAGILISGLGWSLFFRYALSATVVSLSPFLFVGFTKIGTMYYECVYKSSGAFAASKHGMPFLKSMPFLVFGEELSAFPVFFLAVVIGLVLWWRSQAPIQKMLAVCLIVDFAFIFATKIAYKNYLLFPLVLAGLAAAAAYRSADEINSPSPIERALPSTIVIASLLLGAIRWSAFPPTRIPIEDSQKMLQLCPKDETWHGDGIYANMISPIFRLDSSYYAHDQSNHQRMFDLSGFTPPFYPPISLDPLLERPPGVVVLQGQRAEDFLERMRRERQLEYLEVMPHVYQRSDLAKRSETQDPLKEPVPVNRNRPTGDLHPPENR